MAPTITPGLSSGIVDSGCPQNPRAPAHERGDRSIHSAFGYIIDTRAVAFTCRHDRHCTMNRHSLLFPVGPTRWGLEYVFTFNASSLLFMKYIINSHHVLLECPPYGSSDASQNNEIPNPSFLAPQSIPPSASTSHSLARSFVRPSLRIRNTCSADVE